MYAGPSVGSVRLSMCGCEVSCQILFDDITQTRILTVVVVSPTEVNIAVGRPSRQSSTGTIVDWDVGPDRANDGNVNGNMKVGQSCSHTEPADYPWWAVDLASVRLVLSVRIYNRVDCKLDSHGYCPFLSTYIHYKDENTIHVSRKFIYLTYTITILLKHINSNI